MHRAVYVRRREKKRKGRHTHTHTHSLPGRDCSIHVDRLPAGDCSSRLSQTAVPFSFGPSPLQQLEPVTGGSLMSTVELGSELVDRSLRHWFFRTVVFTNVTPKCTLLVSYVNSGPILTLGPFVHDTLASRQLHTINYDSIIYTYILRC